MNPNLTSDLRVTSPRFWQTGALLMRWCRRAALAAIALVTVPLVVITTAAVATGRPVGPLAATVGDVCWEAAFVVPMTIILGRMERTFTGYAEACSP